MRDLSTNHGFVSDLFDKPSRREDWEKYRLSDDQVEFYRENGYVAGIRMLNYKQIEVLRNEVMALVDPKHPGNKLLYQFTSNESADPQKILFHGIDLFEESSPGFSLERGLRVSLKACASCHFRPGVHSMLSRRPDSEILKSWDVNYEATQATGFKGKQYNWGLLQGLWNSQPTPQK